VAAQMSNAGRLLDAREYALAAMRGFDACHAPQDVANAAQLLMQIENELKATGPAPPATPPQP
jgi:hypothetical protein